MEAMLDSDYGSPDVMLLRDVPTPTPANGEVLIEVRAGGVNWADWSIVSGIHI